VNRRELGGDDPLRRAVGAGLGGDPVAECPLSLIGDLPAPAGEHVAAPDQPGERHRGHSEGDVASGDPLGVVTTDRGEQALAGRAGGNGVGKATDDVLGPVEDQVLLAREVIRHGHLRHPGGVGDLGDGHRVEAVGREQRHRGRGDGPPGLLLPPFPQSCRHALTVAEY